MKLRMLASTAALAALATSVSAHTICTVVADAASGKILMQQGDCSTRTTPASTFKIAISLMGFDSGFLKDANTPTLPFRAGYSDWGGEAWRQPTDPARWLKYSVVWYSQQVTESLGIARFADYTKRFGYGNANVAGDSRHDGLTHAWIDSSLQISPLEQVAFLRKVVNRQLPVSAHAFNMTDQIVEVTELPNGWDIHGKTGAGFPAKADGSDDEAHGWGWFVGWASRKDNTLVFARLIQDDGRAPEQKSAGLRTRDSFLHDFPEMAASIGAGR
ncbi:class D beta-lactamase [Pararobbsia alpina]|uniref:Beta-lactamase n=1 Tax=Pararobbsia alpina TaxID=621374 RepID=A0A6S7BMR7_9BURK|nr:class D beta-lactamase [Pararobbsia alpina]CAB3804332.1 Beta-lactamase OXA-18 [Pararobbsia alpina]